MEKILQFLWVAVFTIGLEFIYIGIKIRSDRSYLYFGASSFLLSVVTFFDVWFFPEYEPSPAYFHATCFVHIWSFAALPLIYRLNLLLLEIEPDWKMKWILSMSLVEFVAFFIDWIFGLGFFLELEGLETKVHAPYIFTFLPYAIFYLVAVVDSFRRENPGILIPNKEKSMLLIAWTVVGIAGIIDVIILGLNFLHEVDINVLNIGIL